MDPYAVLGISKDASEDDIKKAYRKLAMLYHPDRNQGDKQAEEKFKEVKEAYERLTEPEKFRQEHHHHSNGGFRRYTFSSDEEMDNFVRNFMNAQRRRMPIQVTVVLALDDIMNGCKKTIKTSDGMVFEEVELPAGIMPHFSTTVQHPDNGKIYIINFETPELNTENIQIDVNTKNVFQEKSINVFTLICGGEVEVKDIFGKTYNLKIKAGTDTGSKIKMSGLGYPTKKGVRADMYILVKPEIPRLSEEKINAIKKII